jgi:lactate dehydrogenase-like 2-hydroxyacid dehydrogenase
MKVVAYNIKIFEKEFLAKANNKKHDITLISNALSIETTIYAKGKEAVIVNTNDDVSEKVINILAGFGIKYIATRSTATDHMDKVAAAKFGIKLANILGFPEQLVTRDMVSIAEQTFSTSDALQQIADKTIKSLDLWQQGKCAGKACLSAKKCQVNKD